MTDYDMLRGLLTLIIDPDMVILKTVEGPTPLPLAAKVEMQVQAAETVEAEPTATLAPAKPAVTEAEPTPTSLPAELPHLAGGTP